MKKVTLYSRSSRSPPQDAPARSEEAAGASQAVESKPVSPSITQRTLIRTRKFIARHDRLLLVAATGLFCLLLLIAYNSSRPPTRQITQHDIDAAVVHTLGNNVLPSPEVKAFENVRRSIVRVRQLQHVQDNDSDRITGIGTGVVIVDKGLILTNLHVVEGAERVQVTFFDGLIADAVVVNRQPENDLAVLQAKAIPDDLAPATLRSTKDLALGEKVIAVGFPFGIGPSVTSGVISGLRREYQSPEGKRLLTNLIQFDAAVNPGNSGGPLVTMEGEVIGIVTGLLNPTDQGVFIGIGFAVPIENAAVAAGESPF